MGNVLKEIFGDTKRINILEELVENWGEFLTIEEIARIAKTSVKTAYLHINELNNIGILDYKDEHPKQFKFKEDDQRALALAILESEEYLRKSEISLKKVEEEEMLQQYFFDVYLTDMDDFKTSNNIMYSYEEAEAK